MKAKITSAVLNCTQQKNNPIEQPDEYDFFDAAYSDLDIDALNSFFPGGYLRRGWRYI